MFLNGGRISNINHKLELEAFTLSKVYDKIIFLIHRFDTVNKYPTL